MKKETLSLLQKNRLKYQCPLPPLLSDLKKLSPLFQKREKGQGNPQLSEVFPCTVELPRIFFKSGPFIPESKPLKVGVVLSGGQAPGGHNVIAGLYDALKQIHPNSQLIGFLNGPAGIIQNSYSELEKKDIDPYRNQGGFDIIGSGRTKIETHEQFFAASQTCSTHQLDGLVIIGGDDSNTNAAYLAEYFKKNHLSTCVVGVPKTIDGDLKNHFIEMSFGFDTASKVYSEVIGNLAIDALSAKKYYFFVKIMGRSASHLTLECALQTHVNMAIIGEEVAELGKSLPDVANEIADLICERAKLNKNYGVILIPEGLLEFIPECQATIKEINQLLIENQEIAHQLEKNGAAERLSILKKYLSEASFFFFSQLPEEIQKQLFLERDPHGNIQLSKIETERLLISLVEKELKKRETNKLYQGKFNPQPLFCGYEGRSGLPTNFDCHYCTALGHLSALLILHHASGYMCCINNLALPVEQWEIQGVPIVEMLHFELRKNKRQAVIQKFLVDLKGSVYGTFKQKREKWRLDDAYCSPGPIQFEGPSELTETPPFTLLY